jgi:hypothetical protein
MGWGGGNRNRFLQQQKNTLNYCEFRENRLREICAFRMDVNQVTGSVRTVEMYENLKAKNAFFCVLRHRYMIFSPV